MTTKHVRLVDLLIDDHKDVARWAAEEKCTMRDLLTRLIASERRRRQGLFG